MYNIYFLILYLETFIVFWSSADLLLLSYSDLCPWGQPE